MMEKLRNLSVKKTILLYVVIVFSCSFFLSYGIITKAEEIQRNIWWKYADDDKYFAAGEGLPDDYNMDVWEHAAPFLSKRDRTVIEVCDILETYTAFVLTAAGSCIAFFAIYRRKLKIPMEELERASKRIAENDLDFQILYENQDEMGQLCREFEQMRKQLVRNNKDLWRNIEEERALRAAIAHDIRSPLSVLKGYQEMLLEFIPDGTIDKEKALEMLSEGMKQIGRMDIFIETMRKMGSLEQREFVFAPITAEELREDIQAELEILAKDKKVEFSIKETGAFFLGDKEVVMEVVENILSNALRYAKEEVEITAYIDVHELRVCIRDDGIGFGEEEEKATELFYQKNVKDSLKHAGLGMYISRLYCEKHGGKLLLENDEKKGAVVTAIFRRIA